MTACPRCAELTARADPTRTTAVVCAACHQTIYVPHPVPGFGYAGCLQCYAATSRARVGRVTSPPGPTAGQPRPHVYACPGGRA